LQYSYALSGNMIRSNTTRKTINAQVKLHELTVPIL